MLDTTPGSVQIGAINYAVVVIPNLTSTNSEGNLVSLYGQIQYGEAKIKLDIDLSPVPGAVTLWHEIFHAVLANAGLTDHDEKLLDALAHGTIMLIRDNPHLITYTREVLKEADE